MLLVVRGNLMSRWLGVLGALAFAACVNPSSRFGAAASSASCTRPETGCACAPDSAPEPCFEPDQAGEDGAVLCREGTRSCEAGRWSECRDVRTYRASAAQRAALVDPNSAPKNCSICDVRCFEVTDPLLAADGGSGDLAYAKGKGLILPQGDAGSGDGGVPADAGLQTGCAGLERCCDELSENTTLSDACRSADSGDDKACDDAHALFCADAKLSAPSSACVAGANPLDDDCDGIPDAVDQCTNATVATDPDCAGSTWPLPPNTHDTVFHVLDEGRGASDALQISYRVRSADVYFLLDTSDTMSEERDQLLKSLTGTRLVDCALLKNCCDVLSGSAKTNCMGKVNGDDQAKCLAAEPTYCKSSTQTDCADTDGDGMPNNENQDDGVVGAVRCLVGDSWFGAGMFRELPFRDGVNYVSFGADDAQGFQDRGSHDEWAFRNYSDLTPNVEEIRTSVTAFTTDGNYDYPEASMIALYSLLTGKGSAFGNESPSIADRDLRGCGPFSFGYPCFRSNAVPVIVLFTDDPM
ncbi:MAG TPA: hypothetical protein VHM19_12235, partial [Polyangiales bacterium]|nr:hypothetical protein [Polyangiales bacterium]